MEPHQNTTQNLIIKIVAAAVVLGLAGFAFTRMDERAPEEQMVKNENTATENVPDTTPEPVMTRSQYKNGTYRATGMYSSPAGQEEMNITLTLKNDIVISAQSVGKATNPGSIKNQSLFNEGFNQYVIGKNVDELKLQVVNGSSLTPKGFLDALVKIKTQAQA